MTKKNSIAPKVNPEKFIREKAKSLPIYKCYINEGWEEAGMANIIIARQHATGNITMGFYLIDLMCLGVKDSFSNFNIYEDEFLEILDEMEKQVELEEISYILAHNIIYGAIAYAEEYGFDPCKTFTSTTIHILEDDTEDVELIEINFGKDGKPLYVQGPNDSTTRANQIINTLKKTAGKGNFDFILTAGKREDFYDEEEDDEEDEDYDEDEEDEDYDEEDELFNAMKDHYDNMSFEEKKKLYLDMSNKKDDKKNNQDNDFLTLSLSIFDDLYDSTEAEKLYDDFLDQLENYQILSPDDLIPDELMGVTDIDQQTNDELIDIYYFLKGDSKKAGKMLEKLKQRLPEDVPFVAFLESYILFNQNKMKQFSSLRKKYLEKFPDYHMLKLLAYFENKSTGIQMPNADDFFKERETIHPIELFLFLVSLIKLLNSNDNPALFKAIMMTCEDFSSSLPEGDVVFLLMALMLKQMTLVENRLYQK